MNAPRPAADATSNRILDVAERLVQTRGFNGFSYADISAELGITKASLHYHFATKAELGRTLVTRYTESFAQALERIGTALPDARARLHAYVKLYSDVLTDERMCLCGMVAAEYRTLPAAMQEALRVFFEFNESWLTRVLELGRRDGTLVVRAAPAEAARMLVGALEGEMLVARAYGDVARFATAAALLVKQLEDGGGRAAGRKRARRTPAALTRVTAGRRVRAR
ncbi:MAG TPA: TetR/AcrR family transcriptional regulator [Steroidobacteraceae bacterium]|jgi:TetR/AcrR family transcriptional repressor of nem operon|nr:TetR/AcrR family transcriptional regulator [Steroidobacteraceae bacterium]